MSQYRLLAWLCEIVDSLVAPACSRDPLREQTYSSGKFLNKEIRRAGKPVK
jgi:hypothetical protein